MAVSIWEEALNMPLGPNAINTANRDLDRACAAIVVLREIELRAGSEPLAAPPRKVDRTRGILSGKRFRSAHNPFAHTENTRVAGEIGPMVRLQ